MTIDVLDQTGKKVDTVTLNPAIFEAEINEPLVAQAIRVRLMNARTGTAATQTRGEVRGGGRKPWRQKGTGRARQGSIRAPQWKGGGVVHGPQPREISLTMPQSMRRAALFSALTDKAQQKQVLVVNQLALEQPKTKLMAQIMKSLPLGKKTLLVVAGADEKLQRSSRNLADLKIMSARVLHPYEVLHYSTIVFVQDGLQALEDAFLTVKKTEKAVSVPKKRSAADKKDVEKGTESEAPKRRRAATKGEE